MAATQTGALGTGVSTRACGLALQSGGLRGGYRHPSRARPTCLLAEGVGNTGPRSRRPRVAPVIASGRIHTGRQTRERPWSARVSNSPSRGYTPALWSRSTGRRMPTVSSSRRPQRGCRVRAQERHTDRGVAPPTGRRVPQTAGREAGQVGGTQTSLKKRKKESKVANRCKA
jgi:hypothetical protein